MPEVLTHHGALPTPSCVAWKTCSRESHSKDGRIPWAISSSSLLLCSDDVNHPQLPGQTIQCKKAGLHAAHCRVWEEAQSVSLKREICRVPEAPRIMKTPLRTQLPATCYYRVGRPQELRGAPRPQVLHSSESSVTSCPSRFVYFSQVC